MRGSVFAVVVFISICIAIDIYSFQALKLFVSDATIARKKAFYMLFVFFTVVSVLAVILFFFIGPSNLPIWFRFGVITPVFLIYIGKLLLVLFLLIDDLRRGFGWILSLFLDSQPYSLSRNKFITSVGVFIGGSLLSSLFYGIIKGAYNYKVHQHKITFPNLPIQFSNFKIVQISDLHVGSFISERPLEVAIKKINDLNPDVILFTGDLVNNLAREIKPFEDTLKKLQAPYGVYSVLGNHDYGDYARWDDENEKKANFESMLAYHEKLGWRLLMDEHLKIEKNQDYFNLVGVQNWGARGNFPKYGNLQKATLGINKEKVTILLSHDPSHWEAQVLNSFKFIDLTLSGHTHGMQFGVEIPGWIKWSPVKYMYPQWAGMYEQKNQKLYVNRGLGFIGYPGRVGISPEISLFVLNKS